MSAVRQRCTHEPLSPSEILIVSDDPSIHGSMLGCIENHSIAINVVPDARLLPQTLPLVKPDLIFLDFNPPAIDAIAVCKQLRASSQSCDAPIILMYACDDLSHRAQGFEAGAADYLIKPPLREEVIAKISTHLKGRTSTQQAPYPDELDRECPDVADNPQRGPNCEVCTELPLQRRYFRDIVHKLSDSIFLLEVSEDGRFRYLETNRAFEAVAGVPEDSLRGKYFEELPRLSEGQSHAEKAIAKFRRCLETGSVIEEEITLDLKSGRRICHASLKPLFNDNGRIDRILAVYRDITDSKQAERLNDFLKFALDQANDAAFLIDPADNHRFRYINDKACRSLGYSRDELLGMSVPDIDPYVDLEAIRNVDAQLRNRIFDRIETFHRSKDGRVFPVEVSGAEVEFDGQVMVLSIVRDISERKQTETLLVQREREFRTLAENMPDILIRYDREGRCTYVNPALMRNYAVRAEQMIGLAQQESNPFNMPETYRLALEHTLATGERSELELRIRTASGEMRDNLVFIAAERAADGQISSAITIGHDITERKQAEALLVQQEREYRSLAENLPDNIVRYNRDGVTVYVNPVLERTLGDLASAMIGTTPREYHPDGTFEDYAQLLDTVLASGKAGELEKILPGSDGKTSVHQISMVPERGENGELAGVLAIGRDISERKRMEEERLSHLRFFESMDRVNRALQGSNDLETVLNGMLDTLLTVFDGDRVFLTYPCDPNADSWTVPFEKTKPEFPGALAMAAVVPMDADVATTIRLLLDADGPVTYGPGNQYSLPKEVSETFGFKSYMAMAVYPKGDKPWQIGIHQCSHVRVWTPDEQKLFLEISRRLSDALTGLLAYREIQERERQFRTLAENLPDNIIRHNREGVTVYVNPALERTLGDIAASMIGTIPREYHSDGSLEDYAQLLDAVLASGKAGELEKILPGPDGSSSIHQIRIVPEHGPDGEIVGALAIGRDVTRKRQLELELIRNERKFRTLAENLPDIIVRYDKCLRRIYNNTVSDKLPDLLADDILSESPPEYRTVTRPNTGEFRRMLQRVIETGIPETTLIHAEINPGNNFYWTMNLMPEFDQDGEVNGVLTRCTDITELKEYQRELEASRSQLRALAMRSERLREDERKRIARELHDDLGQRLTALKLDLARLQLRFGADNPPLQQQIEEMERDLGSTIQIVRNVASQLRPSALEMGVVSALEWLVLEFRRHSHINCRLRIPKCKIVLNDSQSTVMFRIVQESLTNIMRHAKASEVEIVLASDRQHHLLEIRDDGVGFDMDKARKTNSFGLIGIEERAMSLGGTMNIETAPNHGVRLTIRIPVSHPDEEETCSEY